MNKAITQWAMRITYALSGLVVLAFIVYWTAFYMMAEKIVARAVADLTLRGYDVAAHAQPGGFPTIPTLTGFVKLTTPDGTVSVSIPNLRLRGFFIPHTRLRIDAEPGVYLTGPGTDAMWHTWRQMEKVHLSFDIPPSIHAGMKSIPVHKVDISVDQSRFIGNGLLQLDQMGQPAGMMNMRIVGIDHVIEQIRKDGTIDKQKAAMLGALLRGFEQADPETGVMAVTVPLTLRDRWLYAGPIMLWQIPPVALGL
ncbi:DUF2125 domain-containing protein [Micavibrio aeruginosavorus]|uniref:DUF2125 domain-containing protein n=1 Tax=Micavibrio aeruginosavorus TaxID=349221 RepID=UPI003F4AAFEF